MWLMYSQIPAQSTISQGGLLHTIFLKCNEKRDVNAQETQVRLLAEMGDKLLVQTADRGSKN